MKIDIINVLYYDWVVIRLIQKDCVTYLWVISWRYVLYKIFLKDQIKNFRSSVNFVGRQVIFVSSAIWCNIYRDISHEVNGFPYMII